VHGTGSDMLSGVTCQSVVYGQSHGAIVGDQGNNQRHQRESHVIDVPGRGIEETVQSSVLAFTHHTGGSNHSGDCVFGDAQNPSCYQSYKTLEAWVSKTILKAGETKKEIFW
jgi:hypothetical protein